jgi:hypothetical protein
MSGVLEWWDNIRVFRMAEPLPGSPYLEIFRITRAAYRNGGLYVPSYDDQPDPGDVAGVASYWEGQLRQYEEHLADGGPVM